MTKGQEKFGDIKEVIRRRKSMETEYAMVKIGTRNGTKGQTTFGDIKEILRSRKSMETEYAMVKKGTKYESEGQEKFGDTKGTTRNYNSKDRLYNDQTGKEKRINTLIYRTQHRKLKICV